jgi:hypothetical protein
MSPEKIMTILLPCCLGQSLDDDHEAFVENHQGDKSLGAKLKKFPSSKSNNEDIPVVHFFDDILSYHLDPDVNRLHFFLEVLPYFVYFQSAICSHKQVCLRYLI